MTGLRDEREAKAVVEWRRDQLVSAGVEGALAARLACDGRYDLHSLIELLERGCSAALAVRILTPLEERQAA